MKHMISLCLLLTSWGLCGQNFYETVLYDSIEADPSYQRLQGELSRLDSALAAWGDRIRLFPSEAEVAQALFEAMRFGNQPILRLKLDEPAAAEMLRRNEAAPDSLLALTGAIRAALDEKSSLLAFYKIKERLKSGLEVFPENEDLERELRWYKLEDGDRILEIGSGSLAFAWRLGKVTRQSDIYLNDIDTTSLKRMYITLQNSKALQTIGRDRMNRFHLLKGGETTTGAEELIFDQIIIRNTVHHFTQPAAMLASVKQSMGPGSRLIIREAFAGTSARNGCEERMERQAFEALLEGSGFVLKNRRKRSSSSGTYWIYTYSLP